MAYLLSEGIKRFDLRRKWETEVNLPVALYKPKLQSSAQNYRLMPKSQIPSKSFLWNQKFRSDYFICNEASLEKLFERIKDNIITKIHREEQQVIPYESLSTFIEWYNVQNMLKFLHNSIDEETVYQIIWLVGSLHEVIRLKSILDNSSHKELSICFVNDEIQGQFIDYNYIDSETRKILRNEAVYSITLKKLPLFLLQMWVDSGDRDYKKLPIEQYLVWEEWKFQIYRQIYRILETIEKQLTSSPS